MAKIGIFATISTRRRGASKVLQHTERDHMNIRGLVKGKSLLFAKSAFSQLFLEAYYDRRNRFNYLITPTGVETDLPLITKKRRSKRYKECELRLRNFWS